MHADADASAEPVCFLDRRGQLRLGVLVGSMQHSVNHAVRPGLVDLGEVRAFLVLLAHHRNDLVCGVGIVGVRQHMLRGIEAVCVLVPAEDVNGVAADAQPRSGNESLIDGVAHRCVAEPAPSVPISRSAVKPAIRSALAACSARIVRHGTGLLDRLQVFGARMQKQMYVRVDQAGQQRCVAEVDHLRSLRVVDRSAYGFDPFAFNEDLAGLSTWPVSTWSRRVAWRTMGREAGCCAARKAAATNKSVRATDVLRKANQNCSENFRMNTNMRLRQRICR